MRSKAANSGYAALQPDTPGPYCFCPKAYHYYYMQGLRWGQMTAGHALGGTLHRTLEAFHREGAQPVSAAILCLRSGEMAAVRRSRAELAIIEADISALVGTILADDRFHATPGPHCKTCSYFRICPAADRTPRSLP